MMTPSPYDPHQLRCAHGAFSRSLLNRPGASLEPLRFKRLRLKAGS